jgi:hypothetical protein
VYTFPDTREGGLAARRLIRLVRSQASLHAALVRQGGTQYVVCTEIPGIKTIALKIDDGAGAAISGAIVSPSLAALLE